VEDDKIELTAKLKLDTTDAEKQLENLSVKSKVKAKSSTAASTDKVKLDKEASNSLKGIFSGDKGLKNIGKFAKSATQGINGMTNGIAGLAEGATKLAGVLAIVAAVVALIVKLFQGTDSWKQIQQALEDVMSTLRDMMSGILSITADLISTLLQIVKDILPLLQPALDQLAFSLKIVTAVLQIIEPIIKAIGEAFTAVYDIFKGFLKDITGIDMGAITGSTTGAVQEEYSSSLDTWETSGGGTVVENKQLEEQKETNRKLGFLGDLINGIGEFIGGVLSALKPFLEPILTVIKGILEFLKPIFVTIGNVVKGIFENILQPLFNNVLKPLYDHVLKPLYENIMKPIFEFVSGIFDFVKDFFGKLWKGLEEGLALIWKVTKETAQNVFSGFSADKNAGFGGGLFTSQGRWGNGYQFGDITGSALDFTLGVFGKGWLWDDGGTLDIGAQVWGMNEKGNPEFLFNAGGHDTVINAEILEDAMYKAQMKANASKSGKLEVTIKEGTPAGPRELVQWILPSLKFQLKT